MHAASHQAEAGKIAAELAAIASSGMVLPGSITQRRTRCGRRNCACHADPPRLHGPYWQWTRKIAARTICRWLSDGQHRDYQPWIDNDRRLHELLARLEALGTAAFEADPRWQQRGRTSPAAPADQADVGTGRLTCGQAPRPPANDQLRPKREDLSRRSSRFSGDLVHVWALVIFASGSDVQQVWLSGAGLAVGCWADGACRAGCCLLGWSGQACSALRAMVRVVPACR